VSCVFFSLSLVSREKRMQRSGETNSAKREEKHPPRNNHQQQAHQNADTYFSYEYLSICALCRRYDICPFKVGQSRWWTVETVHQRDCPFRWICPPYVFLMGQCVCEQYIHVATFLGVLVLVLVELQADQFSAKESAAPQRAPEHTLRLRTWCAQL
jgi:hypothetical protein